jgi:hypothetical protein
MFEFDKRGVLKDEGGKNIYPAGTGGISERMGVGE